jgi:hypothetical protein
MEDRSQPQILKMKRLYMKNLRLLPVVVLTLALSSCKTLVTDDFPDFKSVPTVNSILVAGKPLAIEVSLTGGLDSLPLTTVNNATIDLYIDGVFTEQLGYIKYGTYTSTAIVEVGKEYKCKVIFPDQDTIVCSQTLPKPSPILKVEHINIAGRDEEGTTYPAVKLTFSNDLSERRYYEVVIRYFQGAVDILNITDPVLLNEGLPIALFSNELIQGSIYTMTLNYTNGEAGSSNGGPFRTTLYPIVVELRSVSYDYYRYKKQYYLYTEGKNVEITKSMTASPLYSNIENGYGIFAGYSVFATDTITPEPYEN